ncbi:RagB/SusD family nutrient uptake outer membrane protein [Flavobacterium sp. RSP49]|uniref:RagB/SusD family nutrient uptake outer membrane protein n=1 Tax=unclassified Flavobacterium TaxID=196869 RepID=UPI000F82E51E|nr:MULTISPECIES: RagB/SusD family nutrient uptake outer membrane protein [unclassified Flavobacterium]RTY86252.1 RagB/SusD family nutrient uptake outer membrane protein [Flavobacterium sp. RSP15]RTY98499.1 RagB/SusD family nutrient uptake outer membrane protein [Flavobacterium sp. RSP49]
MKNKIILLLTVFTTLLQFGCTTLEEEVLDESLTGGATSGAVADGSIAPAYAVLPGLFLHTSYFTLQEISTDEAILPYRGGTDWGDNGIFIDMHRHTYSSSHIRIKDTWGSITQGISRSVTAINALSPLAASNPAAKLYLAEAKGLRAYYSMLSLDLFGLIFVKENPAEISTVLRGSEAVDYIKNEFLSIENEVSKTSGPGRITQGAVWGLLSRLHLNAAVYRNPYASTFDFKSEDMDKVILYTSKIIESGQYNLSSEYFEIFDDENHTNKELIFAVDQRAELNGHNRLAYFSLSGDRFPLPAFVKANGTDGPAITSDFYQTWVVAYGSKDPATMDPRFSKKNLIIPADSCVTAANFEIDRGIIRGQQYGLLTTANGQPFARCADGIGYKIGKLRNITRADKTKLVNHTEKIDFTAEGSGYSSGYRVLKYEFSKKSDNGRNRGDADIVILRLADVYMMRAEAKLRKSNDAGGALADVNLVRASRTARIVPPALTSMKLDLLYRERGFEFYWEMLRRTDMIRFGKYEGTWTEKTDGNVQKRLFPIPQSAIDGASDKPGYLVQNAGY